MHQHNNTINSPVTQAAAISQAKQPAEALSASTLVSNRTEAIAQRKLQEMVNNSERMNKLRTVQRMANFAGNGKTIQRLVYVGLKDDAVITGIDEKRPPGQGGSQGDHSTPFTVLQSQIANAIEGVSLADAWTNLADTFEVYKKLPGWDESTKFIKEISAEYAETLLKTKGDIDALQLAVSTLLAIRNQVAFTSFPKGGHGNAEGKYAGSLQYQERQFQLGKKPDLKQSDVIDYMWKAFDHGRLNNLKSEDKKGSILKQHAITITDAYPQLAAELKITADVLLDNYKNRDWENWKAN